MVKTFIILSSCGWGNMMQRPHHLARALVKLGHEVHFIEPGALRNDTNSKKISHNYVEFCINNRRMVDNVWIYRSVDIYDHNSFVYNNASNLLQNFIDTAINEPVIVAYFPYHIGLINSLNGEFKVVFDCVDDHGDLQYSYWSSKTDIDDEQLLLDRANVVLTTSSALFLSRGFQKSNVYLSMNAVNKEDFNFDFASDEPEDLKKVSHPRICYMGAVYGWFDQELFYRLVDSNPDKSFVVIGPIEASMLRKKFDNLYILGTKKHSELKNYLVNMDIGIIPFKDNIDLIIHCNPIKMYEYLACGLSVVSNAMPDLCINKEYVKTCNGFEEFNKWVNALISYNIDKTDVSEFISRNTWHFRAKQLLHILEDENFNEQEETILWLRNNWEQSMSNSNVPIVKSLYALTYAETDLNKFTELAKEAYDSLKIGFTLKNYILALYLSGFLEEAVQVVMQDSNIDDIWKAELKWANSIGNKELIKIKLLYCIKNFKYLKKLINQLNNHVLHDFEVANYLIETGRDYKAKVIYDRLKETPSIINSSPLYNRNCSTFSAEKFSTYHESQKFYFKFLSLLDKYLERPCRIKKWQSYFSEKVNCVLCGNADFVDILERSDQQIIVSCTHCGLAFLSKTPKKECLGEVHSIAYQNNSGIAIYSDNYNNQDHSYIFIPRLNWIEKTLINKKSKRLLDVGCTNGEFLENAIRFGWEVTGIEISIPQYKAAIKRGLKVYNVELKNVKFENDYFDCVTLWDVLDHSISPINQLKEIYRILKPGGKLYLSTPNHLQGLILGENWFGYNASYENLFYFEPDTLIKMLAAVGFKVDQCFSHERGDWDMADKTNKGHILLLSATKQTLI